MCVCPSSFISTLARRRCLVSWWIHRGWELRTSVPSTSVSLKRTFPRLSPEIPFGKSLYFSEFPGAVDDVSPSVLLFLLDFPLPLFPFSFSLPTSLLVNASPLHQGPEIDRYEVCPFDEPHDWLEHEFLERASGDHFKEFLGTSTLGGER